MERWNIGILEKWKNGYHISIIPTFQYSNTYAMLKIDLDYQYSPIVMLNTVQIRPPLYAYEQQLNIIGIGNF